MRRGIIALIVSLSGCGGCEPPEPPEPVKAVTEAVNTVAADLTKQVDALGEKLGALQAQIDAWVPTVLGRLDKVEKRLDVLESKDSFEMEVEK